MQKKQFFSHDENALSDPKIMSMMSVYGFQGYGWFWAIVESLRQSEKFEICFTSKNYIRGLAYLLRTDAETAKTFLSDCITEFELFESDNETFWSNSLKQRMQIMDDKKEKTKNSALKRWDKERNKRTELTQEETNQSETIDDKQVKQKPVKTENATVAQYSDEVVSLSNLLAAEMLKNNPQAKIPSNKDRWHNDMKLLLMDGYEYKQIEQMILWCQSDDFWKSNILSARKLRDKAGTLVVQMGRKDDAKSWSNSEGTSRASQDHPRINGNVSRERIAELKERARKREEEKLRMSEVSG